MIGKPKEQQLLVMTRVQKKILIAEHYKRFSNILKIRRTSELETALLLWHLLLPTITEWTILWYCLPHNKVTDLVLFFKIQQTLNNKLSQ